MPDIRLSALTNIGLHVSGAGQQLRGAGELAQRDVSKPLTRQSGRGLAPGGVHHGKVGADLISSDVIIIIIVVFIIITSQSRRGRRPQSHPQGFPCSVRLCSPAMLSTARALIWSEKILFILYPNNSGEVS